MTKEIVSQIYSSEPDVKRAAVYRVLFDRRHDLLPELKKATLFEKNEEMAVFMVQVGLTLEAFPRKPAVEKRILEHLQRQDGINSLSQTMWKYLESHGSSKMLIATLGSMGDAIPPGAKEFIESCLVNPDPDVRAMACETAIKSGRPTHFAYVLNLITDPDPLVSQTAFGVIQNMRAKEMAIILDYALGSPDEWVLQNVAPFLPLLINNSLRPVISKVQYHKHPLVSKKAREALKALDSVPRVSKRAGNARIEDRVADSSEAMDDASEHQSGETQETVLSFKEQMEAKQKQKMEEARLRQQEEEELAAELAKVDEQDIASFSEELSHFDALAGDEMADLSADEDFVDEHELMENQDFSAEAGILSEIEAEKNFVEEPADELDNKDTVIEEAVAEKDHYAVSSDVNAAGEALNNDELQVADEKQTLSQSDDAEIQLDEIASADFESVSFDDASLDFSGETIRFDDDDDSSPVMAEVIHNDQPDFEAALAGMQEHESLDLSEEAAGESIDFDICVSDDAQLDDIVIEDEAAEIEPQVDEPEQEPAEILETSESNEAVELEASEKATEESEPAEKIEEAVPEQNVNDKEMAESAIEAAAKAEAETAEAAEAADVTEVSVAEVVETTEPLASVEASESEAVIEETLQKQNAVTAAVDEPEITTVELTDPAPEPESESESESESVVDAAPEAEIVTEVEVEVEKSAEPESEPYPEPETGDIGTGDESIAEEEKLCEKNDSDENSVEEISTTPEIHEVAEFDELSATESIEVDLSDIDFDQMQNDDKSAAAEDLADNEYEELDFADIDVQVVDEQTGKKDVTALKSSEKTEAVAESKELRPASVEAVAKQSSAEQIVKKASPQIVANVPAAAREILSTYPSFIAEPFAGLFQSARHDVQLKLIGQTTDNLIAFLNLCFLQSCLFFAPQSEMLNRSIKDCIKGHLIGPTALRCLHNFALAMKKANSSPVFFTFSLASIFSESSDTNPLMMIRELKEYLRTPITPLEETVPQAIEGLTEILRGIKPILNNRLIMRTPKGAKEPFADLSGPKADVLAPERRPALDLPVGEIVLVSRDGTEALGLFPYFKYMKKKIVFSRPDDNEIAILLERLEITPDQG